MSFTTSKLIAFLCLLYCFKAEDQPLPLLILVPFPDSNGTNGWDRGLELLPAARVAANEVNNDPDMLPGYRLELIERSSDACGQSIIRKGLSNLIDGALQTGEDSEDNAIAVLGLACSTVVASVSPIAGRKEVDLLQLAMANSQILRDTQTYPRLWRFLESSNGFVSALFLLMDGAGWTRAGLIFDGNGVFFNAIANTFREKMEARGYSLVFDQGIVSNAENIAGALRLLQSIGVRLIFAPTTIPESIEIMCQASKMDLVWPGYIWVFPSRHYSEFNSSADSCDRPDLLLKALENIILIDFFIDNRNDSSVLQSGRTYAQYRKEYLAESERLQSEERYATLLRHFDFQTDNYFSNFMYNELWAFALALNYSLPEIADKGFNLLQYQYNHSEITNIIERNLKSLSFPGTLGLIQFNEHREVTTPVSIYQVRGREEIEVAMIQYGELKLISLSLDELPGDDFERRYDLISDGLAITIYVQAFILFVFVSFMFFLVILLRREPEVKASSPLLSLHMFGGCYLLISASVFLSTRQYVLMSSIAYQLLCYIGDIVSATGINLITASVLLRLARVYRIFTKLTKITWVWKNKALFFFVILIASFPILIILLELIVDPKEYTEESEVALDINPPLMVVSRRCFSENSSVFEFLGIVYTMLLLILLLAFAVLTRNVNKKHFNDSKKVLGFVFLFTLVATILVPVSYILQSLGNENSSTVVRTYLNHFIVVISQVFLILPKVLPTFYYRYFKKEERNVYEKHSDEDPTISRLIISPIARRLHINFTTTTDEGSKSESHHEPIFF